MDFDVAMALGYIPSYKQPRWKVSWNRFRARMWPANPPRAPYTRPSSDAQDSIPLSADEQAELQHQLEISDAAWKQHILAGDQVDQGHESPAFQVMRHFTEP